MQIRQTLDEHKSLISVLAGVVMLATFGFIVVQFVFFSQPRRHEPLRVRQAYYYDQNAGELFTAAADSLGPIEAPSGPFNGQPAGVRANVYACTSCDDPERRFVGWLTIPLQTLVESDPGYQKYVQEDTETEDAVSIMVRRVNDQQWVPANSEEAKRIYASVHNHCGEEKVFRCQAPTRVAE